MLIILWLLAINVVLIDTILLMAFISAGTKRKEE